MSKQINPEKMSKFDRQYLSDRGFDPDEWAARQLATDADEPDEIEDDSEAGILTDGTNDSRAGRLPTDADVDYSTWDAKALKNEIDRRNEGRDEDSQIVPEGTGQEGRLRKGDLVSALQADDDADGDDDSE